MVRLLATDLAAGGPKKEAIGQDGCMPAGDQVTSPAPGHARHPPSHAPPMTRRPELRRHDLKGLQVEKLVLGVVAMVIRLPLPHADQAQRVGRLDPAAIGPGEDQRSRC